MKQSFLLLLSLLTLYLNGQTSVPTCPEGHLPPAVASTYEQASSSNKPYLYDEYDHYYNLEDFSTLSNNFVVTTCSTNSGYFDLDFVGSFSDEEVETICAALEYVSTLFTSQQENIKLTMSKHDNLGQFFALARSFYYGDNDAAIEECGISDNLVWEKINTSFNHPGVLTNGIIRYSDAVPLHTLSEDGPGGFDNPDILTSHLDLYSVTLHEVMHLLGGTTRMSGIDFNVDRNWYTRWDSFLYGLDQEGFLINDGTNEYCCDFKEFNFEQFPDYASIADGNCPDNLIVFNSNNTATVNSFPHAFNHLNPTCDTEPYALRSSTGLGDDIRYISNAELDILCTLGYQMTNGSDCENTCSIIVSNDVFITGFDEIEITIDDLIQNDGLPDEYEIEINEFCGDASLVTIEDNSTGTGWIISGIAPGSIINLCYTVTGCSGEDCNEGIIEIEYLNIPGVDLTILPPCPNIGCNSPENLFCHGDFEEFNSEEFSEWSYHAMLGITPCMLVNPLVYGSYNQPEIILENGNQHIEIGSGNFFGSFPPYIENIIVPLTKAVQPDCEMTISFDARQGIGEDTDVEILIYGTEQLPCELVPEEPDCTNPLSNFFCIENSLSVIGTNWQTISPIIWTNSTGSPINYLIITTTAPDEGLLNQRLEIDNLYIAENCNNELTITSNVISSCIGDIAEIEYTVCSNIDAPPLSVEINIEDIVPSIFGIFLSETSGDFVFDGSTTIDNLQGGTCETVNLVLETDFSLPNDAVFEIQISASSEGACIVNNANTEINFPPLIDNADFTFETECLDVEFSFLNENEIISSWDFGNTETSTEIAPTYSYPNSGTYTVNHTISNECYEVTSTEEITVENCAPPSCCQEDAIVINGINNLTDLIGNELLDFNLAATTAQNIYIDELLIINENYDFALGSNICMGEGAEILISPNKFLRAEETHFHGCTQMWRGIELSQGADIYADHCVFEDAEAAVQTGASSSVSLENNIFHKNLVGIYHPSGLSSNFFIKFDGNRFNCTDATLLPPYFGQTGEIGSISYAGIVVNDNATMLIGGNSFPGNASNIMEDMANGIVSSKADLQIEGVAFRNIQPTANYNINGFGIYAEGNGESIKQVGEGKNVEYTFENVHTGIYVKGMNADIQQNNMIGMFTGIEFALGHHRVLEPKNNLIRTNKFGIVLNQTDMATKIRVQMNDIYLLGNSSGKVGISVNEMNSGQFDSAIQDNEIYVGLKGTGIQMNAATKHHVKVNNIHLESPFQAKGIAVKGCKHLKVTCNQIHGINTGSQIGLEVLSSTYVDYFSNDFHSPHTAAKFSGDCNGSVLQTNIFDNNNTGLWLTNSAMFGSDDDENIHNNRGNQWMNSDFSGGGAKHSGNNNMIKLSRFEVADPTSAFWPPNIIAPNEEADFPFFSANIGSLPESDPSECMLNLFVAPGGTTDLDREIAKENIEVEIYNEEILWTAKKSLYRRLDDDPNLINGDSDLQNFYTTKAGETIGQFTAIDKESEIIHEIDNSLAGQIASLKNQIEEHLNQLKILESTLPDNPTTVEVSEMKAVQSLIYAEITTAENQVKSINETIRSGKEISAIGVENQNNSIFVSETYEQNEKTVNDIYLKTIARGNADFTVMQNSQLWLIAAQCPLAGGNAVFKARSLYGISFPEETFNDADICNAIGVILSQTPDNDGTVELTNDGLEELSTTETENTEALDFLVRPNPASSQLTINHPTLTQSGKVLIYDARGEIVKQAVVQSNAIHTTIRIPNLPTGIYWVQLLLNDGTKSTTRVSVIK